MKSELDRKLDEAEPQVMRNPDVIIAINRMMRSMDDIMLMLMIGVLFLIVGRPLLYFIIYLVFWLIKYFTPIGALKLSRWIYKRELMEGRHGTVHKDEAPDEGAGCVLRESEQPDADDGSNAGIG